MTDTPLNADYPSAPCSVFNLLERWEERIRNTPERAKSGGVDYVGGLIDAYGTCLHEIREFLEQNSLSSPLTNQPK